MRFEVDVRPLDLHTNHFLQKASEEDKQFLKDSIQHSLKMFVSRLGNKYDLSKLQG